MNKIVENSSIITDKNELSLGTGLLNSVSKLRALASDIVNSIRGDDFLAKDYVDSNSDEDPKEVDGLEVGESVDALVGTMHLFCRGICETITETPVVVSINISEDRVSFDIECEMIQKLFAKNPELGVAFETVILAKVRLERKMLPFSFFVDSRCQRRAREISITKMAADISRRVYLTKEPVGIKCRTAAETLVLSEALQNDLRVLTSIEPGSHGKKIIISPITDIYI